MGCVGGTEGGYGGGGVRAGGARYFVFTLIPPAPTLVTSTTMPVIVPRRLVEGQRGMVSSATLVDVVPTLILIWGLWVVWCWQCLISLWGGCLVAGGSTMRAWHHMLLKAKAHWC